MMGLAGSPLAQGLQAAAGHAWQTALLKADPGLGETAAFAIIAFIILGCGLASSMAERTLHSVMYLGAVLVGVAALFVVLGSPLIGVIQILVYVGGILTLFIFAVMFVSGDESEEVTP